MHGLRSSGFPPEKRVKVEEPVFKKEDLFSSKIDEVLEIMRNIKSPASFLGGSQLPKRRSGIPLFR